MNHPTRTDHYLMQIAFEVFRSQRKVKDLNIKQFQLKFGSDESGPRPPATPETRRKTSQQAQARWVGAMGRGVRVITKDEQGNILSDTGASSG